MQWDPRHWLISFCIIISFRIILFVSVMWSTWEISDRNARIIYVNVVPLCYNMYYICVMNTAWHDPFYRVTQWREMISEDTQKIGRPRQLYTGPTLRQVPPLRMRAPSIDISLLGSTKSMSKLDVSSPLSQQSQHASNKSIDLEDLVFYQTDEDGDEFGIGKEDSSSCVSALKGVQKAKFHRN